MFVNVASDWRCCLSSKSRAWLLFPASRLNERAKFVWAIIGDGLFSILIKSKTLGKLDWKQVGELLRSGFIVDDCW